MSKLGEYLKYARGMSCSEKTISWVNTTLKNYLEKNEPATEEVEHVIDYLAQNEVPKISRMSYPQAVKKAEKWSLDLQKKASKIVELPEDVETVLDFKDGFRIVKLVGKSAYEREGHLMRHCVASYFGSDKEIYSLRDANNNPHCTMEKDQQIKGKGNGDIHPKYIGYVVKFLEWTGMTVRDSEMLHLGYVNIEKICDQIGNKEEIKKELFQDKYFRKDKRELLKDEDGNQLQNLDVLKVFPLIEESEDGIKVAFNIPALVSASIEFIKKTTKKQIKDDSVQSGGYSSQLAGGYSSQLAGGYSSKLAGGYSSKLAGGDYSQLAGGDYSKLAGGDYSQLAGGYYSQLAGGDSSQLAGGYSSQLTIGSYGIAVGDKDSIARGKVGAAIVLCEREDHSPYSFKHVKAAIIDGKILKEDTWYKLENGEFVETTNN